MNTVEVRLYASVQKYFPDLAISESLVITLNDKAKLEDLLNKLKIPKEQITLVIVNGKREEESYLLRDGDRIGIFPPIAGDRDDRSAPLWQAAPLH